MRCELTGTPERNLDEPDDDGIFTPTASEIANDILNDVNSEYDITTWKSVTDADQAEVLRELIGIYAKFKFDKDISVLENRSELLSELASQLELSLTYWAKKQGFN